MTLRNCSNLMPKAPEKNAPLPFGFKVWDWIAITCSLTCKMASCCARFLTRSSQVWWIGSVSTWPPNSNCTRLSIPIMQWVWLIPWNCPLLTFLALTFMMETRRLFWLSFGNWWDTIWLPCSRKLVVARMLPKMTWSNLPMKRWVPILAASRMAHWKRVSCCVACVTLWHPSRAIPILLLLVKHPKMPVRYGLFVLSFLECQVCHFCGSQDWCRCVLCSRRHYRSQGQDDFCLCCFVALGFGQVEQGVNCIKMPLLQLLQMIRKKECKVSRSAQYFFWYAFEKMFFPLVYITKT